jgi:hypothetical protein
MLSYEVRSLCRLVLADALDIRGVRENWKLHEKKISRTHFERIDEFIPHFSANRDLHFTRCKSRCRLLRRNDR